MKRIVTVFAAILAFMVSLQAQEFLPAAPAPANIPDTSVSLLDFGAVPDGVTLNTEAFSKAVSSLVKKGGGHLIVPEGLWLTGLFECRLFCAGAGGRSRLLSAFILRIATLAENPSLVGSGGQRGKVSCFLPLEDIRIFLMFAV